LERGQGLIRCQAQQKRGIMTFPDCSNEPKAPLKLMDDVHDKRLERQWRRLKRGLPRSLARGLGWLRERRARRVRIPVGILLIVAGLLGFLPILGFWMVPLGLLLLAQDVPFLKRPAGRVLVWFNRTWQIWKRRWRGTRAPQGAGNRKC
jgi:hypothetical protein